jgi:hypothetical protein
VLAASLRDSQAHCRDLEKQISSALSQVAHGHEAVRRLQDEVGTKDAELSSEQCQSRDLRTQIESLVSEYKRQAEVLFFVISLPKFNAASRLLTGVCTRFVFVTFKFISDSFANLLYLPLILFQTQEELKIESDRRYRLEEALRCARICVRCGHPRVFITGTFLKKLVAILLKRSLLLIFR